MANAVGVVTHRSYNTFGVKTDETANAVDCIFGYTGKLFDDVTELQNNVNRWYNPELGKWLSEDPIGFNGMDVNLYRYVGNNTIQFSDPLGLIPPIYSPSNEWLGVSKVPSVPSYTLCDQLSNIAIAYLDTAEEIMLWKHYVNGGGLLVLDNMQVHQILVNSPNFLTRLNRNTCENIRDDTFVISTGEPWGKGLGNITIKLHISHISSTEVTWHAILKDTYDFNPIWWNSHRSFKGETVTRIAWLASKLCKEWKPYEIRGEVEVNQPRGMLN